MKELIGFKLGGYPPENDLEKISELLKIQHEGTNFLPIIIFGDNEVYMKDDDKIIDFNLLEIKNIFNICYSK